MGAPPSVALLCPRLSEAAASDAACSVDNDWRAKRTWPQLPCSRAPRAGWHTHLSLAIAAITLARPDTMREASSMCLGVSQDILAGCLLINAYVLAIVRRAGGPGFEWRRSVAGVAATHEALTMPTHKLEAWR